MSMYAYLHVYMYACMCVCVLANVQSVYQLDMLWSEVHKSVFHR